MSDLHLEFGSLEISEAGEDLLILAGDLGIHVEAMDLIRQMARLFEIPILVIAGNHEFYRTPESPSHTWEDTIDDLRRAADHTSVVVKGEVTFLEDSTVTYEGVRFIGATLWTDMKLYGEDHFVAMAVQDALSDYAKIYTKSDDPIHVQDVMARHGESIGYIRERLTDPLWLPKDGPTVVVTHHAPSWLSIDERFRSDKVSAGFASRLEDLILDTNPVFWVHGHTHTSFDYVLGETRVLCNPRGYVDVALNPDFNPDLIVEI